MIPSRNAAARNDDDPWGCRLAQGVGGLDRHRGDAGDITDELSLLELVKDGIEEGPVPFDLDVEIRPGEHVDLGLFRIRSFLGEFLDRFFDGVRRPP